MRQVAIDILDAAHDANQPDWAVTVPKQHSETLITQLTNDLRSLVREHPEIPAGMIYTFARHKFSGASYEKALTEAAIGIVAKKAITEIIKWVERNT